MMRQLISVTFLFCLGVLCLEWFAASRADQRKGERPELAYGTPTAGYVEHVGYIRGEVGHTTPWVLECLTDEGISGKVSRDGFDFTEDPSTPAEFRVRHKFYANSGYDRGHLPSAANHHGSAMEMRDCHLFTAIVPQTPELNRSNTAWEGLEEHCRQIKLSGANVLVCSGTAFLPGPSGEIHIKTLGDGVTYVPTHCWKTVLIERDGTISLKAWLMPNNHDPPNWKDCELSVDELETAVALDFWNGLEDELEAKLEAAK